MSKFPIIVLDGPDGTGKSTLARGLCRYLDAHYIHLTYRFPKNMFDYHTAAVFQCLKQAEHRPVVLDRWWPSEEAYANVYRGGTHWPEGWRLLEMAGLKHSFYHVVCLPKNKEDYLEHFNVLKGRRTEMYDSNMDLVYEQYKRIYSERLGHRPGVYLYDFMVQGPAFDSVIQAIHQEAEDFRASQHEELHDPSFMNFTGHYSSAKYILVGDQLKPKTRREVWPFFEHGNSSLWLANALTGVGLQPYDVMMTNAFHEDQFFRSRELLLNLQQGRRVIAMGQKASDFVGDLAIPFYSIKHPQYYRRFKPAEGVEELRKVL